MVLGTESFGCAICWPADAQAAWSATQALPIIIELLDSSHCTMRIQACITCHQHFFRTFVEDVDFEAGEDPQFWTVVPITTEEHHRLVHRDTVDVPLDGLAPDRWVIRRNWPKGAPEPVVQWDYGFRLKPV